jgi:flagellar protein FliS
MSLAAVAHYRRSRFTTNDPPGILLMLLDGLERFLGDAVVAFANGHNAEAFAATSRARAIVDELNASLDRDRAPELCERLTGIYLFCGQRLSDAIIHRNIEAVQDTQRALAPIIDGFRQAIPRARAEAEVAVSR